MAKHASILGREAYLGSHVPKILVIGESNCSFRNTPQEKIKKKIYMRMPSLIKGQMNT